MKKGLLLVVTFILVSITPAYANCPEGSVCAVEINCTTGEKIYTVVPSTPVVAPARIEPVVVTPTHTLAVQTNYQSFGVSGTVEQIQTSVNELVAKVNAPIQIDPCSNGGCTKAEVNSTTNVTTVTTLTATEIKQRSEDQAQKLIRNAELAKVASKALPNIQPFKEVTGLEEVVELTPLSEENPYWWSEFLSYWSNYCYWLFAFNWFAF